MILAYLLLVVVLAVCHFLVRWRVARLERRFTAVAAEADELLKKSSYRGGNGRPDPYQAAKHQYDLARLAMKRDRTEERYTTWQAFSERFGRYRSRLIGYRGKVLPYALGVFDVAGVMVTLDRLGVGLTDLKSMLGI